MYACCEKLDSAEEGQVVPAEGPIACGGVIAG